MGDICDGDDCCRDHCPSQSENYIDGAVSGCLYDMDAERWAFNTPDDAVSYSSGAADLACGDGGYACVCAYDYSYATNDYSYDYSCGSSGSTCSSITHLDGEPLLQGCAGEMDESSIGSTTSGDTTGGCDSRWQWSPEVVFHVTLAEASSVTCGGDRVLISTCGSDFDTVRALLSRCVRRVPIIILDDD
jgi:hypothetical protein